MAKCFWDGPCPECHGEGVINDELCPECEGRGMVGGVEEIKPLPDYVRHKAVGSKLRHVRERRGVSMTELAKEFGWRIVHLSNIERGTVCPTIDELVQITEWIRECIT
ncbi:MAG: helix-turn-helix domain-containing protein [Desulfovibrio sp.]|nr:helix-turn-helix domain-containing protein [Desulfovibrio sp.]